MRAAPSVPRGCCARRAASAHASRPPAGRWRCASRPPAGRRAGIRVAPWRAAAGDGPETEDPDDLPPPLPTGDWRAFRARLVATEYAEDEEAPAPTPADGRWAHLLADVEKGCLLLSNPSMFTGDTSQPYFARAVIFLFETGPDGAVGIILNRRTERKLGEIRGAEPFTPEFAASPLYLGGDVGAASMHLLHRDNPEALPSGKTVVRGIAMGGFRDAVAAVRSGAMRAQDFRFFSRYCGWGPGQLEAEVASGVWFLAAASADLIMAQPSDPALRPGQEQAALPATRAGGLWAEVLTLMGGEYAEMARATLDAEQS